MNYFALSMNYEKKIDFECALGRCNMFGEKLLIGTFYFILC
jgi:hypothetical protein